MTHAAGNDTTASDWMSTSGEVVIAVIGASKTETETFVKGLGSTECDSKCRQEDDIFLTMCDVPGHRVAELFCFFRFVEWDSLTGTPGAVAFLGNVSAPPRMRRSR